MVFAPRPHTKSMVVHCTFPQNSVGNGPKHLTLGFPFFYRKAVYGTRTTRLRLHGVRDEKRGHQSTKRGRTLQALHPPDSFLEGDSRRRRGSPKRPFEGPLYTGRTPDSSADKAAFVTPTNRVPNPTATASESRRRKTVLPRMIVAHLLSGQVLHAQQPLSRKPALKPSSTGV